jgi:hypothetical protein
MIIVPFFVGGPRSLDSIPVWQIADDPPVITTTANVYELLDYAHESREIRHAYIRRAGVIHHRNIDDRFICWVSESTDYQEAMDVIIGQMSRDLDNRAHFDGDLFRGLGGRSAEPEISTSPRYAGDYMPGGYVDLDPTPARLDYLASLGHARPRRARRLSETYAPGPEPGCDAARWTPDLLKEDDHVRDV